MEITLKIKWFGIDAPIEKILFWKRGLERYARSLVFCVIYLAPSGENEIIHPRVRAGGQMITLAITSSWSTKCPAIYQGWINS